VASGRGGIPVVAIVGRPNVGKSTLFNRFLGQRSAIVEDRARTTRDRLYGDTEWNGRRFVIVDTGGLELDPDDPIEARVQEQAHLAIAETPITYAARPEGSRSKLRSVPDGLRHVRFMLACTSAALIWVPAAALVAIGAALIVGSPTGLAVVAGGGLVWVGGMLAQAALMVRAYRLLLFDRPRRSLVGVWRRPRVALAVALLVAVTITVAGEARLDLHRHPVTSTQIHHHRL